MDNGNPWNATQAIATTATHSSFLTPEVCKVLHEAVPIILQIALDLDINLAFEQGGLGSFLSTKRPLVTKYVLNSEFVSTQRVDDITALWISTGNTITLLTLLMQQTDHKDTIIIYITRKSKKLFSTLLINLIISRFGVCFYQFLSHHHTSNLISTIFRVLLMQMKKHIWRVFAVSLFSFVFVLYLISIFHL